MAGKTARVESVRTSLYLDDELWLGDGPSGLSGRAVRARPGHRVTIITVSARNSDRTEPVLLWNHDTRLSETLTGRFAPLLRSRHEWPVLLGSMACGAVLVWAGLEVLSWGGSRNPGLYIAGSAFGCLALAVAFVGKRRKRLRERLERQVADIAVCLAAGAEVASTEVNVEV